MLKKRNQFLVFLVAGLLVQTTARPMEQFKHENKAEETESELIITDNDLRNFDSFLGAVNMHPITTIDAHDVSITDEQLSQIIKHCCNTLKSLRLERQYIRGSLQSPNISCPNLTELGLSSCTLQKPTINCPMLDLLNLTGNTDLTDAQLREILIQCGALLSSLHLNSCPALQDPIADIFKYCPKLKVLDLMGCNISEEAMSLIPRSCQCVITQKRFKRKQPIG